MQEAAAGRPLHGQGHNVVERTQGGARLVEPREEARDLAERRHGTAAEQAAGDQGTDRELALADPIHAVDHDADRDDVGGHGRRVDGERRQETRPAARFGSGGDIALPPLLHAALARHRLQRLQPGQGLHQQAVLGRRLAKAAPDGAIERHLDDQADQEDDRDGDRRHEDDGAADQPDDDQEEEDERQVDQGDQSGRGEEVAQRLVLAQIAGERARRGRP